MSDEEKPQERSRHEPRQVLPLHANTPARKHRWINPTGESNRNGVDFLKFCRISFFSRHWIFSSLNLLWPLVIVAIVVDFIPNDKAAPWKFLINYASLWPTGHLLGLGTHELSRKFKPVIGLLIKASLGSSTEVILFIALLVRGDGMIPIIKEAIAGAMLANLFFCLGICFFLGGLKQNDQSFDPMIGEIGSNLLLVATLGLTMTSIFSTAMTFAKATDIEHWKDIVVDPRVYGLSHGLAVILLVTFFVYLVFQFYSRHEQYGNLLKEDELQGAVQDIIEGKERLTMTEAIFAVVFGMVTTGIILVISLGNLKSFCKELSVSEEFIGLILIPLAENAAQHLIAFDDAKSNRMNTAVSQIICGTVNTVLFSTPVITIVAWATKHKLSLAFNIFEIFVLILSIITFTGFMRDGNSNYLKGFLCVILYTMFALAAYYMD